MKDDFPSYYSVIPATVRYDERLTASEKLLYGEITALTNKDGYCYATNGYFARLYKCTEATVSVHVSNLQKCGYITVVIEDSYKRRIYLQPLSENLMGVLEKSNGGIRKIERGVLEKSKDNNTSNNTKTNIKVNRDRYGEYQNVLLSKEELAKLQNEFPADWEEWIERVSDYCASRGKRYTNYLATIRNWARRDAKNVRKNDTASSYQRVLKMIGGDNDG